VSAIHPAFGPYPCVFNPFKEGINMPDNKRQPTAEKSERSSAPSFVAYHVREIKEGKDFWTRIGSAWEHKDGNGLNLQIDAIPFDGRITLRRPEEKATDKTRSGGRKPPAPQP
jgi:hypothetical protein